MKNNVKMSKFIEESKEEEKSCINTYKKQISHVNDYLQNAYKTLRFLQRLPKKGKWVDVSKISLKNNKRYILRRVFTYSDRVENEPVISEWNNQNGWVDNISPVTIDATIEVFVGDRK